VDRGFICWGRNEEVEREEWKVTMVWWWNWLLLSIREKRKKKRKRLTILVSLRADPMV